jgi:threonine/homoserine/homoserine lactone efflux protein
VNPRTPTRWLLAFTPLLLERSYGGTGELVWRFFQGTMWLAVVLVVIVAARRTVRRATVVYGPWVRDWANRVLVALLAGILVWTAYDLLTNPQ